MQTWMTVAWYELIQFLRLRSVVIIMFILPLFLIFLLGTVFDNQMKPVNISIHIADQGPISKDIEAFLEDERTERYAIVSFASSGKEVLEQLREGSADYGIVVPKDFSARFISTTFFVMITTIINSFQVFALVFIMTQGGPGTSTAVITFYIYQVAFSFYDMGYASAMAWILFAAILFVTWIQWQRQKRWVHY